MTRRTFPQASSPKASRIIPPLDGRLSDCFLIATLNAIAHRQPGLLENIAERLPDGTIGLKLKNPHQLTDSLPGYAHGDGFREAFAHSPDSSTLAGFVEKAWARDVGGYDKVSGQWPHDAMEWLTGRQAHTGHPGTIPAEDLIRFLDGPQPTVASSASGLPPLDHLAKERGVVTEHAYSVVGARDGLVTLFNPWGDRHPPPLPVGDFVKLFPVVSWLGD